MGLLFCFYLVCGIFTVCLFALPLDVIGKLCSVIVVVSGHFLYFSLWNVSITAIKDFK